MLLADRPFYINWEKRRHHENHNSIYYIYSRENQSGSYLQSSPSYIFFKIFIFGKIFYASLTSLNTPIKVFIEP